MSAHRPESFRLVDLVLEFGPPAKGGSQRASILMIGEVVSALRSVEPEAAYICQVQA